MQHLSSSWQLPNGLCITSIPPFSSLISIHPHFPLKMPFSPEGVCQGRGFFSKVKFKGSHGAWRWAVLDSLGLSDGKHWAVAASISAHMEIETEFKTKHLSSVTPLHLVWEEEANIFVKWHYFSSVSPATHLSQKPFFDEISRWHDASARSLPGSQSQMRATRESYQQVRLEAPASREEMDSNVL